MISSESIEEFVTEASASIEAAPQMNEAMTRKAVLDQFCDLLNWDFPRVAKVEYPCLSSTSGWRYVGLAGDWR